ncbi:MAG TPA: hypothetical protein VK115_10670 [Staphylococcus sp.]|nr:hypothetical protein [Staphylococcus sp.]
MTYLIGHIDPEHAFGINKQQHLDNDMTVEYIPQYDFHTLDIYKFDAIIIPNFVDQLYFHQHRTLLEEYLNTKKVIVFFGHLFKPWLPNTSLFMPQPIQHFSDYAVYPNNDSAIYAHVEVDDMTFNKGVAGFFARGYYQTRPEHEIHLTFRNGHVVTYVDRNATSGTLFIHAGRSLLGYVDQNKTTDYISQQFMTWLKQEISNLSGGKTNE